MYNFVNTIYTYVCWYIRPLVKWFLRKTTKLCEMQRICYGHPLGAWRTLAVESSLNNTRTMVMKSLVEQLTRICNEGKLQGEMGSKLVDMAVVAIITAKRIDLKYHKDFVPSLTMSLAQIFGYKQLLHELDRTRHTPFSEQDPVHEAKLLRLWQCLMPDMKLEARITKQWGLIGFQGENPKTDFRGMGLLGLENLLFFAGEFNGAARHVLSHSHHPQYGYSFAIVGINLTSLTYELMKEGHLKTHFFNVVHGRPSIKHFHRVYTYLFFEFDKFWLSEKPRDIMEFSRVRDSFKMRMTKMLKDHGTVLRLNCAVEIV